MDVDRLAERLRDPDPRVRVETLRILAMVEETRALEAVRWIFQNDPEPGVREVANWAGRLIYAAHQRGYSTQRAIEELFARPQSSEHQELFLSSMAQSDLRYTRLKQAQQYAVDQTYRRQIDDIMRGEDTVPADPVPLLPAPSKEPESLVEVESMDERQLLDAGLSAGFWEK
jgi:hypothetical protein